jgi:2-iminobutanoate/2-iminopropanoate deaminase
MHTKGVVFVVALAAASAVRLAAQQSEVITAGRVQGLPFSPAVRVGHMVYLSGQLGTLPGTRQLVDTGIAAQTRQALQNINAVLTAAGSSLSRVVKCTVFLADIRDYASMNEVYATFFAKDPPARSTVAGSGLALGARIEIDCLATTP